MVHKSIQRHIVTRNVVMLHYIVIDLMLHYDIAKLGSNIELIILSLIYGL